MSSPLVHDSRVGNWGTYESAWPDDGDRNFNYLNAPGRAQRATTLAAGVQTTATGRLATRTFTEACGNEGTVVGMVNMPLYAGWMGIAGLKFASQPNTPGNCDLQP